MPKKKASDISQELLTVAWRVFRELTRNGQRVSLSKWWGETRKKAKCSWDRAKETVERVIAHDQRVHQEERKGRNTYFSYQQPPKGMKTGVQAPSKKKRTRGGGERSLYSHVVEWIREEEKGCKAAELADKGKKAGGKWWTPDVVAVLRPDDYIQNLHFSPEVISVEIKAGSDVESVITGFGQACAYKVFSHKSYFVASVEAKKEERLLPLCDIFGIGLILFEGTPENPKFSSYSRAKSHQPSIRHVAKFLKDLPEEVRQQLGLKQRAN